MLGSSKFFVTIRVTVVMVFILATLITSLVAIGLQQHFATQIATNSAQRHTQQIADNTRKEIMRLDRQAASTAEVLSRRSEMVIGHKADDAVPGMFGSVLSNNQEFYAVYYGFGNGDFYELINLEASPVIRQQLKAAHVERFAKIEVFDANGRREKHTTFLTTDLLPTRTIVEESDYKADARPWYTLAQELSASKTKPYMFKHLQAPGQTYVVKVHDRDAVIAVDIALSTMSNYLAEQVASSGTLGGGEAFVFLPDGEVIASNRDSAAQAPLSTKPIDLSAEERAYLDNLGKITVTNELDWAPLDFSVAGQPRGYFVDLIQILAQKLGAEIEFINGWRWTQLVQHFQQDHVDILMPVHRTDINKQWGLYSEPMLNLPMALAMLPSAKTYTHLAQLEGKKVAIPEGWSIIAMLEQEYPLIQVVEVESVKDALLAVKDKTVDAALESGLILKYLSDMFFIEGLQYHLDLDIAPVNFDTHLRMVVKPELAPLHKLLNRALDALSEQERAKLSKRWLRPGSRDESTRQYALPYQQILEKVGDSDNYGRLTLNTFDDKEYFVYLAPLLANAKSYLAIVLEADSVLAESIDKVKKSILVTALCLLALLPVSWLFAHPIVNPIRRLALENRKVMERRYKDVKKTPSAIREIDDLATSLVDMSDAIADYQLQQQRLMDSFIEIIAQAIDDKSRYTAGHCNRVPELGIMLANAASNDQTAYYRDFTLEDEDKQREFRLAAWLHDCGKITTPEHIVDKGTKLETNYNRIHEIRTRFEVLWRDAEIDYLKSCLATSGSTQELEAQLTSRRQQLHEDFDFVASSNVGGESMDQESIDRLQKIAQQSWQRHFDNRKGLGPLEEQKYPQGEIQLPISEPLLSDRAEHIIPHEREIHYDPRFGIKIDTPKYRANQGEIYNLSICRGTLTAEDRYIINAHIISTIKMLENLPFPKELKNVPRYASTHHETLKGTGYPRKLKAAELSIPERILVLADIFEALTAADRPYKKAKPLSMSVDILYKMCLDEHVDIEIFNLFLRSGIYMEYAQRYLKPSQIDEVDVSKYLKS